MTEQFNLSDKTFYKIENPERNEVIKKTDVKQFIKLLKEKPQRITYKKWINLLAGDDLK